MPRIGLIFAACLLLGTAVAGQEARRPSHCIAIADAAPGIAYVQKASWRDPLPEHTVRISYITHASFLVQSASGVDIVTDFTGFTGVADFIPDVVTMNHAHDSHWTAFPDPAIPHVLKGWGEFGKGVDHYVEIGDVLIRNVSTDIRSPFGDGVETRGNSIFVFEMGGLCIGHLGHLHHVPNDEQFAALGRLDVVMAAVDGGMTMPLPDMIRLLQRLKSSVVIPMHWFSGYSLQAFLSGISDDFAIEIEDGSSVELSLRDLPSRPTVVVLRPEFLTEE